MKKPLFRLPEGMTSQARSAFLIIAAYLGASLIANILLSFQLIRAASWQLWAAEISIFAMVICSFVALLLARRGRYELGVWLTTGTALVTAIFLSSMFSGLGLILLLSSAFLNTMVAIQTLRSRQATAMIITGIAAGVVILLIDLFFPTQRLSIPSFQTLVYVLLAVLLLLFSFFISRQFRQFSLRTKLVVSLVGITLVSISIIGVVSNSISSAQINEQVGTNLSVVASSLAREVAEVVDSDVKVLSSLSLNKFLQDTVDTANVDGTSNQPSLDRLDQQWKNAADNDPLINGVLKNELANNLVEFRSKFPAFLEIFVTDKYGAIIASTNRTSDYYQADEEWWQVAWNNGNGGVYISQATFDESANSYAIDIALPVSTHNTTTSIGVLRATIDINELAKLISSTKIGQTGRSDLLFQSDQALTAETGLDTLSPEDTANLATLPETYGQITYEGDPSLVSQAPVLAPLSQNKDAIEQLGWTVVIHQHIVEAQEPVATAMRTLVLAAILMAIAVAVVAQILARFLVGPISRLTAVANQVTAGDLKAQADVEAVDEIGTLATAFNTMTSRLREFIATLESRVDERTNSLVLAAEVGRSVSQVRDLHLMLKDAAEIIRSRFDLYYAQVYLTNPAQNALILEAGTGTVGEELLGRGHRLPLNTGSINGRATVEKHSIVISDTTASATFKPNPLLPDTRSEMAVPLLVGENVVGVLDLQSEKPGTLNQDTLAAFEALAGQLAIAIQNANLLAEAESARAQVEAQARHLVREGWEEHLDAIHRPEQIGFVFDHNNIVPLADVAESQLPEEGQAVSAPISIAGETLGSLVIEIGDQANSKTTTELVTIVARQVAQQIENLRLLESAERYRYEAEKAASLQTLEGWQKYIASRPTESLGYFYDTKEVRPQSDKQDEDESMLALPLKAREEMIGKLSVQGLTHEDQESVELVNAVAERLSAHIENLRLFEETRLGQVELDRRARQLAAVAEISTISSREQDVQKMLETVVHLTQRKFGLYHAQVFLFDEATRVLKTAASGWREGDPHEGTQGTASILIDQERSLVARAARTQQAVVVNDVHSDAGWLPNPLLPDTQAEMAIPLVIGDQVLGVLDVQSDHLNTFNQEDASIQATLASQVATSLQNARSFERAQKQAKQESMLNAISQKIQTATTVEAVLQIAARELGHALGAPLTIAQLGVKANGNGKD